MNNICSYMKIGEILLKQKSITSLELENALKQQRTDRSKKLGTILIENNYITENIMLSALSDQLSIQAIDLDNYYFDPDAAKLLSESTAKRTCCMPLRILDDRILIAMDDPLNIFHIEDIEAETGKKAEVVLARKSQIMTSIDKYMGRRSHRLADCFRLNPDLQDRRPVIYL
jgi:type IV pilus assembly protein PilB